MGDDIVVPGMCNGGPVALAGIKSNVLRTLRTPYVIKYHKQPGYHTGAVNETMESHV